MPDTLWWNDGPIRDEAKTAVLSVLRNHGYDLPGVADLCAGAALQVASKRVSCPIVVTLRIDTKEALEELRRAFNHETRGAVIIAEDEDHG